ncbi:BlaI/MecI/CopY family transcriptional regulator [Brevibacillus sp. SIMBA_040]|uniref:BlaI/MecI/CopY family transcriptional regulator n=1 Tax=unclassified Brevibacillus TaxID=2684853 RepID=UPI003979B59F
MSTIPRISESEWEIMKVIWKQYPKTAEEIAAQLPAEIEWSDQTVRTFLNRLVKKKAIKFERAGRSYLYFPTVSEKDCVKAESKSFVNRVFGGAAKLMVTNFLEDGDWSEKEIEQLQKVLEDKKGNKR